MTRESPERTEPRGEAAIEPIRDNPFYILGLRPIATRQEIEREGQKLLGMLELGLKSASAYATPLGPAERTSDKVRRALAELRDPDRRLAHELWARIEPREAAEREAEETEPHAPRADAPWTEALRAMGWTR